VWLPAGVTGRAGGGLGVAVDVAEGIGVADADATGGGTVLGGVVTPAGELAGGGAFVGPGDGELALEHAVSTARAAAARTAWV
jgi:hypothetical protein